MSEFEPTDDELERESLYFFWVGPAVDKLRVEFLIDGREYPDAAATRADVLDAGRLLRRHRVINQLERIRVGPSSWRPNLPTWREYRSQHYPEEPPITDGG